MKPRDPRARLAQGVEQLEALIRHGDQFANKSDAAWIAEQLRGFLDGKAGCKTLDGAFGVKRKARRDNSEKAIADAKNQASGIGMQKSADGLDLDKTALKRIRRSPAGVEAIAQVIAERLDARAVTPKAQRRARRTTRLIAKSLDGDKSAE